MHNRSRRKPTKEVLAKDLKAGDVVRFPAGDTAKVSGTGPGYIGVRQLPGVKVYWDYTPAGLPGYGLFDPAHAFRVLK